MYILQLISRKNDILNCRIVQYTEMKLRCVCLSTAHRQTISFEYTISYCIVLQYCIVL